MPLPTYLKIPPILLKLLFASYWIAMFIGTHIPSQLPHLDEGYFDKIVHFTAYAGLTLLFAVNWQVFGGHLTLRHYLIIATIVIAYGALDEILQDFVHRDCNFYDWIADILGTTVALFAFHRWREFFLGFIQLPTS